MGRLARVYFNERLAGTLEQREQEFIFQYNKSYLAGGTPLSFHLPLQEAPFITDELMPFFENLTSEGWLRALQSRSQKIDESDRFGLLLENGQDLVGAVTVIPFN